MGPVEDVDSKLNVQYSIQGYVDVQNSTVICVAIAVFQYCIVWP